MGLLDEIDGELKEVLPNKYWEVLKGYGEVAIHTINVVICTM